MVLTPWGDQNLDDRNSNIFFYYSPSLSNHPLFFDLWFMIYDNFPRTLSVCQRGHFSGNPSLTSFQSSLPIINNWSPILLEVSSPLLHADNADDQGRQQQQAPAHAEPEDGKVVVVVVGRLSKGEVSQEIGQYYNHLSSKLQNTRVTSSSAKVSLDSVPFWRVLRISSFSRTCWGSESSSFLACVQSTSM